MYLNCSIYRVHIDDFNPCRLNTKFSFALQQFESTMEKVNANKPSKKQAKLQKQKNKQSKKQSQKPTHKPQQNDSSSENADIDFNHVQQQKQEVVQVSFVVGQILQEYYHSLKTILVRLGQITKINNSEIADAILQNKQIGNVVLADDDQEQDQQDEQEDYAEDDEQNVYSVLTIFSGKTKISKRIRAIISKAMDAKHNSEKITKILTSDSTGILLNERLSNLPAFVVNSAHEVFKKDLLQLKQSQPQFYQELCSGYLLNISEIQYEGSLQLQKLIYSKFQDFEMCKRSELWWLGERNQSYRKKADMRNLYYVISVAEYIKGVDLIKTYLEE